MKEFMMAALPWILVGLGIAVLAALAAHRKNQKRDGQKGDTENYGTEGMCMGMCLGTALGSAFGADISISLSIGMLLGLVIGTCIKKEDKDK